MPDPEPEAQLQANASLSPVSPSPVHTAAPLVVPALQSTVDTIDAMVAAAVAPELSAEDPVHDVDVAAVDESDDDVVDDDSFDDAYNDPEQPPLPTSNVTVEQLPDSDDYAKTFDSSVNSEKGDDEGPEEQTEQDSPTQQEMKTTADISALIADLSSQQPSAPELYVGQPHLDAHTIDEGLTKSPPKPENLSTQADSAHPHDEAATAHRSSTSSSDDVYQPEESLEAPSSVPVTLPPVTGGEVAESRAQDYVQPPPESHISITSLPASSSLPPRPPQPSDASQTLPSQHHPGGSISSVSHSVSIPHTPSIPQTYVPSTTSGTSIDMPAPGYATDRHSNEYRQRWDQFLEDERQYMSEAKWDRFPEGSRIFIGNLSSDKVSKRDVFDEFHKFGRLAQISLKSAYGFVQYHTVEEGHRAMEGMRDAEIKGRRIQLEISKVQDKSKKDRPQSPNRNRGRESSRQTDRYGGSRDSFNRGRGHSPRQSDGNSAYGGGRSRGRSRSPGYERNDRGPYRQRSRSPRDRLRHSEDLDLPRRYGADVPDVQIILQPDVDRQFVGWVENTFKAKGLKTEVMFLHPRMPKDQVIQRQAVEGVHAVVDLDARVHYSYKIPVQAFDRSGGSNNVRFDQYVDLDPNTAADVILRAKASSTTYSQPSYNKPPTGYPQYGGQPLQYPPAMQQPQYPSAYPQQQQQQQHQQHQQSPLNAGDLRGLLGHVDERTLQQLLANAQPQTTYAGAQSTPAYGAQPANPQVDVNALLASLSGKPSGYQAAPPQGQYGNAYPQSQHQSTQPPTGDEAEHVRNALGLLAKFR